MHDEIKRMAMTIYHGGYEAIETPRIIEGEFAKDFGQN